MRQRNVPAQGGLVDFWVAFRDGRTTPLGSDESWWRTPGLPAARLLASGGISSANAGMLQLLTDTNAAGTPVGVRLTEVAADISAADATAVRYGASSGRVSLPGWSRDGPMGGDATEELDYHVEWDPARPGAYSVILRSARNRALGEQARALGLSPFRSARAATLSELLNGSRVRTLRATQRLSEAILGERWTVLVIAGIVRLHCVSDEFEPTLQYGAPGTVLGTHLLPMDDDEPTIGLEALTPSSVVLLDPERLMELAEKDPAIGRAIRDDIARLVKTTVASYAARSGGTVAQRLARELLLIAHEQPGDRLIRVSEQQLADGIGAIRESVGRTIASLRRAGWVATTHSGVILMNPAALEAVSAGTADGTERRPRFPPGLRDDHEPRLGPGIEA